jgi:hypothetical protein
MLHVYFFIIPFIAAIIVFRVIIFLISKPLSEITVHTREGAKFHHLHFGVVVLFVGILLVLTYGKNNVSLAFLGFGFGMIIDEYIPSLYLPEPEPFTSTLYRQSFAKTAILALVLAVIIVLVVFIGPVI